MRTRLPTCLSVGFGAFFASVAMGSSPLLAQCRQIANLSQPKLISFVAGRSGRDCFEPRANAQGIADSTICSPWLQAGLRPRAVICFVVWALRICDAVAHSAAQRDAKCDQNQNRGGCIAE